MADSVRRVSIADARRVCESLGARQVIVLVFDADGRFSASSYGETRAECGRVGKTLDAICDRLDDGRLPNPRLL
jgi:hypothetical protein